MRKSCLEFKGAAPSFCCLRKPSRTCCMWPTEPCWTPSVSAKPANTNLC